jgi:hypothetical protein
LVAGDNQTEGTSRHQEPTAAAITAAPAAVAEILTDLTTFTTSAIANDKSWLFQAMWQRGQYLQGLIPYVAFPVHPPRDGPTNIPSNIRQHICF